MDDTEEPTTDPDTQDALQQKPVEAKALQGAQFRLLTLFLVITFVAVVLAISRFYLGLGILIAILTTPALIRASLYSRRRRNEGRPLDLSGKIAFVVSSIGMITVVAFSSGIAFYINCWVGFVGSTQAFTYFGFAGYDGMGYALSVGMICGGVVGLLVAGLMVWKLWPVR